MKSTILKHDSQEAMAKACHEFLNIYFSNKL